MSTRLLKKYIENILHEADISDIVEMCYADGSSHIMMTCRLRGRGYYLKFADEENWRDHEFSPSLQNLAEYLAYRIYGLYSGVKVPKAELVYDEENKRVGLATSPVRGTWAGETTVSMQELGKMMSQGVYVDIFLANWDVLGTNLDNVFVDNKGEITRIDPGAALQWRAQGGRKGELFSGQAGELKTMLDPNFDGAGKVFQHANLVNSAETFLSVPWSEIASTIKSVHDEVSQELSKRPNLKKMLNEWNVDIAEVLEKLEARHKEISNHAKFALSGK